jgi:hypothetical protein
MGGNAYQHGTIQSYHMKINDPFHFPYLEDTLSLA